MGRALSLLRSVRITRKAVLRGVLFLLISILVGTGVWRWNAKSLTGNVLPMPFGFGVAVVLSGSMEPKLSRDDVIFVVAQESYQKNDIVVFQSGFTMVVHEIIEHRGDTVVTKGTANDSPDDPIPTSAIKGKVVGGIPAVGVVVTVLKSPVGTLCLVGLAVLLLLRSYKAEKEEAKEAEDLTETELKEEIERLKREMQEESDRNASKSENDKKR